MDDDPNPNPPNPVSGCEAYGATALRAILRNAPMGPFPSTALSGFGALETPLIFYIPAMLAEVHLFWQGGESLDGFHIFQATKIDDTTIDLRGLAILITDQTVVPCDLQLQVDETRDEFCWYEFRLGKEGTGRGGMERVAFRHVKELYPREDLLKQLKRKNFPWAYAVGFGERRASP